MSVEAPRLTEGQAEWAVHPLLDPAEDCRWVQVFDLVLAAQRDVSGNELRLNWIKGLPQCVQA